MAVRHIPVLLDETIALLTEGWKSGDEKIFLDGTLGGGGHSSRVIELFPKTRIVGLDRDPEALERAGETLLRSIELRGGKELRILPPEILLVNESFRNLDKALDGLGIGKVDAVLLDIGLSSDQLDASGRGFSFRTDEPLDMRMSGRGFTAADILNNWDEETLELIIRGFGEEKHSWRIAKELVKRRELKPFATTFELSEAVRAATPAAYHHQRTDSATKTFQAIRIAVNEELTALEEGVKKGLDRLEDGGRMAVISFHSLEDRIVKNFFRERAQDGRLKILTKRPLVATDEETERNPRSRSAKLRAAEKL